jgi:hypothetical protein
MQGTAQPCRQMPIAACSRSRFGNQAASRLLTDGHLACLPSRLEHAFGMLWSQWQCAIGIPITVARLCWICTSFRFLQHTFFDCDAIITRRRNLSQTQISVHSDFWMNKNQYETHAMFGGRRDGVLWLSRYVRTSCTS